MGPRSHERGNLEIHHACEQALDELQWDRVLMNAETLMITLVVPALTPRLQWGRVLMNAETPCSALPASRRMCRFNGAAFS